MKFEQKIKQLMAETDFIDDKNKFLDALHYQRERKMLQRHRFFSGLSMCILILFVGISSVTQFDKGSDPWFEDNLTFVTQEVDLELENYLTDLSIMLVDASDDIWATVEFLDEMNFDIVNQIKEKTQ
jgi:hypothetical protein